MVRQVMLDHRVQQDNKDRLVLRVLWDHKGHWVNKVHRDPEDCQAPEDWLDLKEMLDHRDQQVQLGSKGHLVQRVILVLLALQVLPDQKVFLDLLDFKDQKEMLGLRARQDKLEI